MEIRAYVGASLAAKLARKLRLYIGQPDVIRPSIAADRGRMPGAVIGAIDQQTAHPRGAHLGEGDLLRAGEFGHTPLKRGPRGLANRPMGWALEWSDTPPIGAVEKRPETSEESGSLLIF